MRVLWLRFVHRVDIRRMIPTGILWLHPNTRLNRACNTVLHRNYPVTIVSFLASHQPALLMGSSAVSMDYPFSSVILPRAMILDRASHFTNRGCAQMLLMD